MEYDTIQYYAVHLQYTTIQNNKILHNAIQYNTIQYNGRLTYPIQYNTMINNYKYNTIPIQSNTIAILYTNYKTMPKRYNRIQTIP